MSNVVEVKCPTCHHPQWVDLEKYNVIKTIYRRDTRQIQAVEYRFYCPTCDANFIQPITFTEDDR